VSECELLKPDEAIVSFSSLLRVEPVVGGEELLEGLALVDGGTG